MKLFKNICFYTIVLCLFSANITAQETALIKIDPDRKIDTIDPNIYGAFVEPIRTVVYGNIYDSESQFADEYAKFCSMIGADNFLCINGGTGMLDDARNWLEYCNYDKKPD